MNGNDKEKVILSIDNDKKFFEFDDFIKSLDNEIIDIKSVSINDSVVVHNIVVVNNEKNKNDTHTGILDDTIEEIDPIQPLYENSGSVVNILPRVGDEIVFTNRKQKVAINKPNIRNIHLSKDINRIDKIVARSKNHLADVFETVREINLEKEKKSRKSTIIKDSFEDGLKNILFKLAMEKIDESNIDIEIDNELFETKNGTDSVLKSKEYCKDYIYPLLMYIKKDLISYERYANIITDLDTLTLSLEINYKNQPEYEYVISIKNSSIAPVLQIKTTYSKGGLIIRKSLTDINIDVVSRADIYQDFIDSYISFLSGFYQTGSSVYF